MPVLQSGGEPAGACKMLPLPETRERALKPLGAKAAFLMPWGNTTSHGHL